MQPETPEIPCSLRGTLLEPVWEGLSEETRKDIIKTLETKLIWVLEKHYVTTEAGRKMVWALRYDVTYDGGEWIEIVASYVDVEVDLSAGIIRVAGYGYLPKDYHKLREIAQSMLVDLLKYEDGSKYIADAADYYADQILDLVGEEA